MISVGCAALNNLIAFLILSLDLVEKKMNNPNSP